MNSASEEHEKNLKIATFRFGLISEFVTGVKLVYGEKEKLLQAKVLRSYDIPFSSRNKISRACLEKWIVMYKKAGFRLEGLYPLKRSDKGVSRALLPALKLAIKELKKEAPLLKAPALITLLRHKKLISHDERINSSTLYRYLKHEKLMTLNEDAVDKRHFEAEHPNDIWQSDVMHGPHVRHDGKSKKAYLIAIIDDHSRYIVYGAFYLSEARESFLDCLRQAILKRGLPQKLYIDNGACYKALHLEQVAAQLGIGISHSRPYTPQGRGKIERWFGFVRDNFLAVYEQGHKADKLELLNHHFETWVEEYNQRVHSTTKESPHARYQAGLHCVRPAPSHLIDYFRQIEFRRVKKDRTLRLLGSLLEAPVSLIDRQVELRFHPEDLSQVEIFFQNRSYGYASVVSPFVNANIGRNWDPKTQAADKGKNKGTSETLENQTPQVSTGQLFPIKSTEEL